MATTATLTENSRQGINSEKPPCVGPEAWLSPTLQPGCGHAYDETPVDLVVYVRNDPVNLVDPTGESWQCVSYDAEGSCKSVANVPDIGPSGPGSEQKSFVAQYDDLKLPRNKSQQNKLNKAKKSAKEIAGKKDCLEFLDGLFAYASEHYQGSYGVEYASADAVVSLAQKAQYHISNVGDTTVTPGGVSVGEKLSIPKSGTYTKAFVERGQNMVYLGQGAFEGNLGVTVLHEALHISYYDPDTQEFVGFGLSDTELATAVGVYREGMTNEQASLAFASAMGKKCR